MSIKKLYPKVGARLGKIISLSFALVVLSMPIAIPIGINFPHGKYWEFITLLGVLLLCDGCTGIYMIMHDDIDIERPTTNNFIDLTDSDEWEERQPKNFKPYYYFKKINSLNNEIGLGIYLVLLGAQIAWFQ